MYQPPLAAPLEVAAATTGHAVGTGVAEPLLAPFEIVRQIAYLDLASEGRV